MINLNKSEKEKLIGLLKKDGETKANLLLIKRLENSMKSIKPRSAKNKGLEDLRNRKPNNRHSIRPKKRRLRDSFPRERS